MGTHYLSRVFGVLGHSIERGNSNVGSFAHGKSLFTVEVVAVVFHIVYLCLIKLIFAVAVCSSNVL